MPPLTHLLRLKWRSADYGGSYTSTIFIGIRPIKLSAISLVYLAALGPLTDKLYLYIPIYTRASYSARTYKLYTALLYKVSA